MIMKRLRLIPEQADMEDWLKLWEMRDSPDQCVVCRSCGACQFIEDGVDRFPHTRTCGSASAYDQFPWRDLDWIADHMKRGPSGL
jgi:ferredoxin